MLAADLELRGPSRVAWIETMYLADRRRTMPEIAAAVDALSEHGDENGAVSAGAGDPGVPRISCVSASRWPALVAPDLAKWEYWDAVAEYAALLTSNVRLDRASRRAIVIYLERCPRAEAKAALTLLSVAPEDPPYHGGQPRRPDPTGAPSLKRE